MENGHTRAKRGFTLAEVLLTVAIITVLMAVAIPGVIALRRELKMRELDDTAREIFLAAQNHLTAQKAAGTMGKDGDAGTEDPYADDCYWLSSRGGASEHLLPMGTIEGVAAGNHYLIWYNAASATVLEVYYAEEALPESEIEARERGYSDSYGTSHRAERREAEIGYYNGENLNRGELEQLIPPLLTIINENDLKAVVTMPVQYENGNPAGNRVRTVLELQITGQNADGETVTVTIDEDRYTLTVRDCRTYLSRQTAQGNRLLADRVLGRETMGGADIKLFAVLGLHFSPALMLLLLILACLLGLLFACLLRRGGKQEFPFGPAIAAAWLTALLGAPLLRWYLSLFAF